MSNLKSTVLAIISIGIMAVVMFGFDHSCDPKVDPVFKMADAMPLFGCSGR